MFFKIKLTPQNIKKTIDFLFKLGYYYRIKCNTFIKTMWSDIMKCPNCSYESNEKYCQMCGTKMPDEVEQTAPESEIETDNSNVTITPEDDGFTASFTGTPQSNTPIENNPYAQKTQPEPMQYNTYNNYQPQNTYSAPYPQPPQPNAPQGYPVPPQPYGGMPVPQYNPEIPKKSNVLPIIITCIISVVIVAGLVIGIFSAVSYSKTLIEGFIEETVEDTDSETNYLDSYSSTYDEISSIKDDQEIHKMGEYAEFENFKVTLKDVEQTDSSSKDTLRTEFTFEIENTSDETVTFYYLYVEPIEIYGDEYDYTLSEWLNENIDYDTNDEVKIKSGEKFEFSIRYAVPKDAENLGVRLNLSSSSDDYTDYFTTFSAEK